MKLKKTKISVIPVIKAIINDIKTSNKPDKNHIRNFSDQPFFE